jgi:hypothetical protein
VSFRSLAALEARQGQGLVCVIERPPAESTSSNGLCATVEAANRAAAPSVTRKLYRRPSSSAGALVVAVGTEVPAEFNLCGVPGLTVDEPHLALGPRR